MTWFGLTPSGEQISISHEKLMAWAYDHDMQYQVGWSDAVTMPDGARLARTRQAAIDRGWNDLAQAPFGGVA